MGRGPPAKSLRAGPGRRYRRGRIKAYRAARLDAGAVEASIHKELAALKRMFRLALEDERILQAPIIESKSPDNARKGVFTVEEALRVEEHLDEDMRPLWLLLPLTGWRPMDFVGRKGKGGEPLRWSKVGFEAGIMWREESETKNKARKAFPLVRGSEPEAEPLALRERTSTLERATGRIIPRVFHRNGKPIRDLCDPMGSALDA